MIMFEIGKVYKYKRVKGVEVKILKDDVQHWSGSRIIEIEVVKTVPDFWVLGMTTVFYYTDLVDKLDCECVEEVEEEEVI